MYRSRRPRPTRLRPHLRAAGEGDWAVSAAAKAVAWYGVSGIVGPRSFRPQGSRSTGRPSCGNIRGMRMLLGGAAGPIGRATSFIEAPLDRTLDHLTVWRRGLGQDLHVSEPVPYPKCLRLLEPLERPWTTELLLDCGSWTGYLNNDTDGGDLTSAAPHIANTMATRCVAAMHTPMHGPGHAATQLWLHAPEGQPPLMYQRSIGAVATDGHWEWHEDGLPLPFENTSRYSLRRIRQRFDRETLIQYLAALGIRVDDVGFYGTGRSVRQEVAWPTRKVTVDEARRALEIERLSATAQY